MPKVYLTRNSKRDDERTAAFRELMATVYKHIHMQDITINEACALMGMGRSRFYSREVEPEKLRLDELISLRDALKIPYAEISPILEVLFR